MERERGCNLLSKMKKDSINIFSLRTRQQHFLGRKGDGSKWLFTVSCTNSVHSAVRTACSALQSRPHPRASSGSDGPRSAAIGSRGTAAAAGPTAKHNGPARAHHRRTASKRVITDVCDKLRQHKANCCPRRQEVAQDHRHSHCDSSHRHSLQH